MTAKAKNIRFYHRKSFRILAGSMIVIFFFTMVLQSGTLVAISRSSEQYDAAVNYLADNTEYVNKSRPQRVEDYLKTLIPQSTLEDYYTLASTQIARAEYGDALRSIEKCLELYNNEGQELYLDLMLKRGCLQVMLGDYDKALKSLDLALAENPAAADIYLVKAQIYAERQNLSALSDSLTSYLQLVPGDSSIRALLAQAQFSEGDYDSANLQYEEILQRDPNAEIEYLYGLNAVKNSDFAAAEASLTSAIAKDDSFDGIYYYRGVCRMSLEDYPAAIEDLTASINRNDMLQASLYTRGVCLLMDNQFEKGLNDINFAAYLQDDEEVARQAQLLLAELEAAQSQEEVLPDKQLAEITLPVETFSPAEQQEPSQP